MKLTYSALLCALALTTALPFPAQAEERATQDSESYYRQTLSGNYLASRFAQRHQDWKKASEFVSRLVVFDPENETLNQKAMILAMGSGNYDQAFTLARQTLDQDPQNIWALMFTTLESLANKDYKNASALMDSTPANSIAGFINPVLRTWIKAEDNLLETEFSEDNPLNLFHIILAADYLDRTKGLSPDIEIKIEEAGFEDHLSEQIADIFAQAGLKEKALRLYQPILGSDPTQKNLNEKINRVENGESIEDLIESKQIRSTNEGIAKAMFDVARILYREYNDESAQIFANMALVMDSKMTQAKILLAHIQTRHERYEDAIRYYSSIDKNDPTFLPVQYQAAELLNDMGRKDEAVKLLELLVKEHDDMEALILLGDLHRRHDSHAEAIKIYDRAFRRIGKEIPDEYWSLYYARGMAYEQSGKWEKAKSDLQKALTYKPDHPYLLNYLGYSLADRGEDLNKALNMIEKAVSLRPQDGYITDSLGWAHYMMGNYEKAIKPLERAVELLPYDPTINDHLGDAYWQVGRKLEAQFQWRRALNHAETEEQSTSIEEKLRTGLASNKTKKNTVQEASNGEFESLNP